MSALLRGEDAAQEEQEAHKGVVREKKISIEKAAKKQTCNTKPVWPDDKNKEMMWDDSILQRVICFQLFDVVGLCPSFTPRTVIQKQCCCSLVEIDEPIWERCVLPVLVNAHHNVVILVPLTNGGGEGPYRTVCEQSFIRSMARVKRHMPDNKQVLLVCQRQNLFKTCTLLGCHCSPGLGEGSATCVSIEVISQGLLELSNYIEGGC